MSQRQSSLPNVGGGHNGTFKGLDLTPYPTIVAIDKACGELDAFRAAEPDKQPDAV